MSQNRQWIQFGKSFDEFGSQGGPRPGVLIEVELMHDKDRTGVFLIGDINEAGGICDCCRQFFGDSIVRRYKVVLDPDTIIGEQV